MKHSPSRTRSWQILAVLLVVIFVASCTTPPSDLITPAPLTTVPAVNGTPLAPSPSMELVIPRPVSVEPAGGSFELTNQTIIYFNAGENEARAVGEYLADHLNPATGYSMQVQEISTDTGKGNIHLSLSGADPALGPEGYELTITPDLVKVVANQPAGLFYGIQTIRQLLPPTIDWDSVQPGPWTIGAGKIRDYPRFAWRGTMLDVARHFFSVRDVTRYIDMLAYYKINRLHLHLTDDQGWRIQINSWPNLALYGGSIEVGGTPGGYFSQDDYTYIVNYAQHRFITIIPEVEMPGHSNAALASYAELNCNGIARELFTGIDVGFSTLCTKNDVTYAFVEDVVAEIAALTPGPYFHIGGDETAATEPADYIEFVNRVQNIVADQGKQMVGFEEIAQARLLENSIVQHWNLNDGFAPQAAQQGLKIIMSPADRAYLDMKYTSASPLGLTWAGLISVEKAYSWDPAALVAGVTDEDIIGVEAPLWAETLNTLDDIEYMAFPRILGYAEMGWTPQAQRNWYEYKPRLAEQGPRLQALGINFYPSPEIPWP